jgi:hypothetical protein
MQGPGLLCTAIFSAEEAVLMQILGGRDYR